MQSLPVLRFALLAIGVLLLLAATVLFDPLVRRPIRAWLRLNERLAGSENPIPRPLGAVLEREWLLRGWQGLGAVLMLGLWWYFGTADGGAWWAALFSQRTP